MIYCTEYDSPLGMLTIAGEEDHIIGLWMQGQKYFMASLRGMQVSWDAVPKLRDGTPASEEEMAKFRNGFPKRWDGLEVSVDTVPVLRRARDWLDRYFAGEIMLPGELPLAPAGSAFRQAVWEYLCEIPYGEVTTYGEIARKMAARLGRASMSAQAVGGAVGHNPISIIIPCHRVVGANGNLTGYAGGIDRKIQLLKLEGVVF